MGTGFLPLLWIGVLLLHALLIEHACCFMNVATSISPSFLGRTLQRPANIQQQQQQQQVHTKVSLVQRQATALPFLNIFTKQDRTLRQEILKEVSNTDNGKSASVEKQLAVLDLVNKLEKSFPFDPIKDKNKVDGEWYLQYTSPSVIGDNEAFPDAWKPSTSLDEAESNKLTELESFRAQGTISASGVFTFDTSRRVVKQIIDLSSERVVNTIDLPQGHIRVAGGFRIDPQIPNRLLVAFDTCEFELSKPNFTFQLNFLFDLLALFRRTRDNGWLEVTYVDQEMRIGRGHKGTMFVLTRSLDAVQP